LPVAFWTFPAAMNDALLFTLADKSIVAAVTPFGSKKSTFDPVGGVLAFQLAPPAASPAADHPARWAVLTVDTMLLAN